MTNIEEPNCHKRKCVHYMWMKGFKDGEEIFARHICAAFLDGIPDIISYGEEKLYMKKRYKGRS